LIEVRSSYPFAASVVVVSFNTRRLLRECLTSLLAESGRLPAGCAAEVLVIDNASSDGSAEMVAREFSDSVRLLRSEVNLGFGVANNLAMEAAQGRYLVLINSDAFFEPGALARALAHMDADPGAGIGGARLVGRDGAPQPSARTFHSIAGTALVLSGISERTTRMDHDAGAPASVDWVTGAFMILRREALARTGLFDPAFFLYFEEVDLCRRVKSAGFRVMYWPDVVVTHHGGESSRTLHKHIFSESEAQVVLWRMRSTLLYFRKHHGWQVWLAHWLEQGLLALRRGRNRFSHSPARRARGREAVLMMRLMRQAWQETQGGRVSPPTPW
jgi:GT2 family glycosyltransferase